MLRRLLTKVQAQADKLRERLDIHILVGGFEERFQRKATVKDKELIAETYYKYKGRP